MFITLNHSHNIRIFPVSADMLVILVNNFTSFEPWLGAKMYRSTNNGIKSTAHRLRNVLNMCRNKVFVRYVALNLMNNKSMSGFKIETENVTTS